VTVDCTTLGETAHSQLFGHAKGSFSGAFFDHLGFVDKANGGTLFLDEFHLLSPEVQGMLLRVLDSGKYNRLGETTDRESDFRLITAASTEVQTLIAAKKFSRDLWFRAAGKVLDVPSLSERKACIPKLVYRFLESHGEKKKRIFEITSQAIDLITSFSWGGNIRDLHNSLTAVCAQTPVGNKITDTIIFEDLKKREGIFGTTIVTLQEQASLKEAIKRYETILITQALSKHKGNVQRAASALQVPRGSLRTRCKILGLQRVQ
jgi:DNA-binding NtrC family response regulator